MKLPAPPRSYFQTNESARNRIIEDADRQNRKIGQDIYLSPERLVIPSADGTKWALQVDNTGLVGTVNTDTNAAGSTPLKNSGDTGTGNYTFTGTLDVGGAATFGSTLGTTGAITSGAGYNLANGASITVPGAAALLTGAGGGTWSVRPGSVSNNAFSIQDSSGTDQWVWDTSQNLATTKSADFGIVSADNGQGAAGANAALNISGGGYAASMALFPRLSAGSYAGGTPVDAAGIIYGLNAPNTGVFVIAPWNTNGTAFTIDSSFAFNFIRPGSTAAGSFVAITSPGSSPGLVGFYNGTARSDLVFGNGSVSLGASGTTSGPSWYFNVTTSSVRPSTDNNRTCGDSSHRWSVVYAGTGTINTSDGRDKTPVAPMSADEIAAAKELSSLPGTYQWLESIAEKGAAKARRHVGFTVQQAIAVMTSHNLDPMDYGFICYDKWDADPDNDVPAGDRFGFRMDQLCLFLIRGLDARLSALESPNG